MQATDYEVASAASAAQQAQAEERLGGSAGRAQHGQGEAARQRPQQRYTFRGEQVPEHVQHPLMRRLTLTGEVAVA